MLSQPGAALRDEYQVVIIGSGYGGAITACRLAQAGFQVCVLERGKEWSPGDFPDALEGVLENRRSAERPLGLYEYLPFKDIDVLKGSGLGGTSLINAGVAFRPDPEMFTRPGSPWPRAVQQAWTNGELLTCYERAEAGMSAQLHPRARALGKVQALYAARRPDAEVDPVRIAVSFQAGRNHFGISQPACTDCGDCFTGCNVGAKNTLMMNYLPAARAAGASLHTGIKVEHIEKDAAGFRVHYHRVHGDREEPVLHTVRAGLVILAAGSLGTTELLLRSAGAGLPVSAMLGKRFSGNGNFFAAAYNGARVTNVLGCGSRAGERTQIRPGPAIVAAMRCSGPYDSRMVIEDLVIPHAFVDAVRVGFPALAMSSGKDTDFSLGDQALETLRIARDLAGWDPAGALNASMLYIAMGQDHAAGELELDGKGHVKVTWPTLSKAAFWTGLREELYRHTQALGGTYLENPRWQPLLGRNLLTAHPLGGCAMADDSDGGVTDDRGRVFDGRGGIHSGLYVADGALVPDCIGRNPLLTISALAERIAEGIVRR